MSVETATRRPHHPHDRRLPRGARHRQVDEGVSASPRPGRCERGGDDRNCPSRGCQAHVHARQMTPGIGPGRRFRRWPRRSDGRHRSRPPRPTRRDRHPVRFAVRSIGRAGGQRYRAGRPARRPCGSRRALLGAGVTTAACDGQGDGPPQAPRQISAISATRTGRRHQSSRLDSPRIARARADMSSSRVRWRSTRSQLRPAR